MKILAIIPSRGGSVEIPLKNIIRINKKPLQFYTISAALESKWFSVNYIYASKVMKDVFKNYKKNNSFNRR